MTKYCIIGNSAAAVGAVEAIRENDKKNKITIISKEPYHVYSRPLISYLLAGKITEDGMYYRDFDFYKKNNVEFINKTALKINTKNKTVILDDGKIKYDNLLISTGGTPFVPPTEGMEKDGVFTFTTWDDAKEVSERLSNTKKAVVIGGGMIGIKASEALKACDVDVTIVELADTILSTVFDETASNIAKEHLEKLGIRIITGNSVSKITGKNKVSGVVLNDGQKINCNLVIFAIGVRPNVDVVKDTGIKVNRGIVIDEHMETSEKCVFAAGDVAEAYDSLVKENRLIPIWPLAYKQGKIAGSNMSGVKKKYDGGFVMNSIELIDLPTISFGLTNIDDGFEVLSNLCGEEYKKIVLKDGCVVGAIFIGCIDRAGILSGLIRDKIDVSSFKDEILSDNFGYISFPKELRKERLLK